MLHHIVTPMGYQVEISETTYSLIALTSHRVMYIHIDVNTLLCLYCGDILMSRKLSLPEVTSNLFMKSKGIFSLGFSLFLSIWFKHKDLFVSINSLVLRLYPFRSNFITLTPYYGKHQNNLTRFAVRTSIQAQLRINVKTVNHMFPTTKNPNRLKLGYQIFTHEIFRYKIIHFYFLYCAYMMYTIYLSNAYYFLYSFNK